MEKLNEVLNNQYGASNYRLESVYQKTYDEDMTFRQIANDLKLPTKTLMKYTSKIKVGEVSLQDKDINKNDVYFVEDNALKKNEYGYNLDELDNDFIDSILNKK